MPISAQASDLQSFRPGTDGNWDTGSISHALRRCSFGAPPAIIEQYRQSTPQQLAEDLFSDTEDDEALQIIESQAKALGQLDVTRSWFVHRLLRSPKPALEKLTLFWHDHFATSNRKVEQARLMLKQIRLFRDRGAGSFKDLLHAVAVDPAMILWLDGMQNRRDQPNENFARELMELFSLGIGAYTEVDIREAARAFTGWTVRGGRTCFSQGAHDTGRKTVFGKQGTFTARDIVDLCCAHTACAPFIAGKLARFYLGDAVDPALAKQLGDKLRACDLNIGTWLRWFCCTRLFYRQDLRRQQVASPADYLVGICRNFDHHPNAQQLARHLERMGQDLLRPPGVQGWEDGQEWLDSNTILARWVFAAEVAADGKQAWHRWPTDKLIAHVFPDGLHANCTAELITASAGDQRQLMSGLLQLPEAQFC